MQLVQRGGVRAEVANHLASAYGGRAWDVLALARPTGKRYPRFGIPLAEGYPYVEAEVRYACREHAVTVEDVLSRRSEMRRPRRCLRLVRLDGVDTLQRIGRAWLS